MPFGTIGSGMIKAMASKNKKMPGTPVPKMPTALPGKAIGRRATGMPGMRKGIVRRKAF